MTQILKFNNNISSGSSNQFDNTSTLETLACEIDDSVDLLRRTTDEVLVEYALLNLDQVKNALLKIKHANSEGNAIKAHC